MYLINVARWIVSQQPYLCYKSRYYTYIQLTRRSYRHVSLTMLKIPRMPSATPGRAPPEGTWIPEKEGENDRNDGPCPYLN